MTATTRDAEAAQQGPPARPNVVFVITDQQRFDTIAALGADHVDTPVLDRLVAEGTAFTRTYVTAPSCSPSRASLFTGVYPHTLGVLRNEETWRHSWVELLAEAGYHCVSVGKMHTHPWETPLGFHERTVVENKDRDHPGVPFFHDQWDKALRVRGAVKPTRTLHRTEPGYRERLGAFEWQLDEDLHADVFVGQQAVWWLDTYPRASDAGSAVPGSSAPGLDAPFFLQVGFPGPHPPYDPVARHLEPYRDRDVPLPVRSAEDLDAQPDALKELRQQHLHVDHDSVVHLAEPTDEQSRRQRRHYLANVSMIDEQIGLLLEALERRGVLELAGVAPPAWMEARSLLPVLRGQPWQGREHVFSEHARDMILTGTDLMTMVRDERWKYVELVDSDQGQLFDMVADPDELRTLWDATDGTEAAAAREHLRAVVARWRARSALSTAEMNRDHR